MSAVAALGLAMALAAGCSGSSGSPRVLPPLSTTPAATPSTAPAQDPKAAAVAVVKEFFRAKNAAIAAMDPAPLAAIETPACSCRRFLGAIRSTARKNEAYFGTSQLLSVNLTASTAAEANVLASYDTSRGGTRDASGHVLFVGPARRNVTSLFTVKLVSGHWLIDDIANVNPGRTS